MRRRKFSRAFLLFSLFLLSGCEDGPKVDVCVSDPASGGFQCIAKDQKTTYFIEYPKSKGMIGVPAEDFKTLLEWIKRNKK